MERAIHAIDETLAAVQSRAQAHHHHHEVRPMSAGPKRSAWMAQGFQKDAMAALTAQLLSAQAKSLALEEENAKLQGVLDSASKFKAKMPKPTQGQKEVDARIAQLHEVVDVAVQNSRRRAEEEERKADQDGQKLEATINANKELRSQVANLKLLLANAHERNEQVEALLQEEREEHEKVVLMMKQECQTLEEQLKKRQARAQDAGLSTLSVYSYEDSSSTAPSSLRALKEELEKANTRNAKLQDQYTKLYEYFSTRSQSDR